MENNNHEVNSIINNGKDPLYSKYDGGFKVPKSFGRRLIIGLVIVALLITASGFIALVPAGHRGVLVQLGAVQNRVLGEGLNFKIPFIQEVVNVEVRIQKTESDQMAASKDLQNVSTKIAVNYSLNKDTVNDLYQEVGLSYEKRIIEPAVSESLKAVTALYSAEQLISKRAEVSSKTKEILTEKLRKYDIDLMEINITQFKFSEEFDRAIESKQKAEQDALKAKRDLERIQIEAQQKIEQAQAEAKSLSLKKQEVTKELVQLKQMEVQEKALEIQSEAIKKWDGKLPTYTGGDSVPFINIK
jgi:regulator of protease activity HflC (stomatin/prohibitin superfamily)